MTGKILTGKIFTGKTYTGKTFTGKAFTGSILALTAACALSLASPASAKPRHNAASHAPVYQNDNSAVKQLFREPSTIEAWKNAFPS